MNSEVREQMRRKQEDYLASVGRDKFLSSEEFWAVMEGSDVTAWQEREKNKLSRSSAVSSQEDLLARAIEECDRKLDLALKLSVEAQKMNSTLQEIQNNIDESRVALKRDHIEGLYVILACLGLSILFLACIV